MQMYIYINPPMFICCSYRVTVVGLCSPYCFSVCSVARSHPTLLQPHGKPVRLLCPRGFPGRDTGVGCHSLLQLLQEPRLMGQPQSGTLKVTAKRKRAQKGLKLAILCFSPVLASTCPHSSHGALTPLLHPVKRRPGSLTRPCAQKYLANHM